MEINIERKEVCRVVSARNLSEVKALMAGEKEIYMVFDRNASWVADKVTEMVPGVVRSFAFDTSEEAKSINAAMSLCALLLDAGASREALLLAVGGGITTDLTGFAASIYKRGIRYANIPTTLLAQVDAAIGGKTGVNFAGYKNMVGAIVQPAWTFICPEVLKTLQRRDFLSGAAEMLKTFLLDDGDGSYECAVTLLSKMQAAENAHGDSWQAIFEDDADQWAELLRRAAAIKAGVVERDPFEKGERRILNLGHTFAHAIEALQFSEGHHGCCGRHGGCGHHGEGQEHHCCHGEEGHEEGEALEYGIDTHVWYRRKPMDLNKFDHFVATKWPKNIIRAKGLCYFSDDTSKCYLYEQAGRQKTIRDAGLWYASMPKDQLEDMLQRSALLRRDWDPEYGDRMQKIVFIGQNLDKEAIDQMMDSCLQDD